MKPDQINGMTKVATRPGDLVKCLPDTGCATPAVAYGVVLSGSGSRQLWIRWESGLKQRLRDGALREVHRLEPGSVQYAEARQILERRGVLQ